MHVDLFDRYESRSSLIHQLDPRVKVLVTVLFILSNALLPDGAWLAFILSWSLVLFASWLSGLGIFYVLKRSFVALPFALAAVSVIFAIPGDPIAAISLASWRLVATDAGLLRFTSIILRSWLSVQMAILLTATTQFPDLMHALRHLRAPQVLLSIISVMYRYLFVLVDETGRLLRAREARSARFAGSGKKTSLAWRARVTGNMAGQLFLRSYDRSERVYSAMLARGYRGQLLTLNPHEMKVQDWALGMAAIFGLILIQILARS